MKILGSSAIVRSTDREGAVRRFAALFGASPMHEFPIEGRDLDVSVFPGVSVLSGPAWHSPSLVTCGRRCSSGPWPRLRSSCEKRAGPPRVRSAAERACWRATPTGTFSSSSRTPANSA